MPSHEEAIFDESMNVLRVERQQFSTHENKRNKMSSTCTKPRVDDILTIEGITHG